MLYIRQQKLSFDQLRIDEIKPIVGEQYYFVDIILVGGASELKIIQSKDPVRYIIHNGSPSYVLPNGNIYPASKYYTYGKAIKNLFFLHSKDTADQFIGIWFMKFSDSPLHIERLEIDEYGNSNII